MNLKNRLRKARKRYGKTIFARKTDQSIILTGELDTWEKVVSCGYFFTGKHHYVVNTISLKGVSEEQFFTPAIYDNRLDEYCCDCLVIGGGIIGATILRELSKYNLKLLLIEKEADVALGASGANDGMIHAGIDLKKGSLKAKYTIKGNAMYQKLSEDLDFPYQKCGQIIVFKNRRDKAKSYYLLHKAKALQIPGVSLLTKEEVKKREPWIADSYGGLLLESVGIVSPYQTVIAFSENAIENGANISLETVCLGMERKGNRITGVKTNRGMIRPKIVINAAGVFADSVSAYADDRFFSIHPRKGTDIVLDAKTKQYLNAIVSSMPKIKDRHSHTKGGGIISTVDGNILIGPDAFEVRNRVDTSVSSESIHRVFSKHHHLLPMLEKSDIIAYFSGIRAATYEEDFIVGRNQLTNLIHVAGIQSPGLTAAPAIAEDVANLAVKILQETMEVNKNDSFNPYRKRIIQVKNLNESERDQLIKNNPDYGKIICRCEQISLGEIKAAIASVLPAKNLDAVKRRVRTGMGRCQGGFCLPLVLKILAEEQGDLLKVTKRGTGTEIGLYKTKEVRFDEVKL